MYSFWTQNDLSLDKTPTIANYTTFLTNPVYLEILARSVTISFAATALVIVTTYPVAAFIAFRVTKRKALLLLLITAPFWTSYLVRLFAWKVILGYNGVINSGLIWLGLIEKPLSILLYNPLAVVITLAHAWAAFALLPIYISLERIDRSLIEASRDLGDDWWATFYRVVLPLSMPGVVAASLIVFVPTVGDYITPQLVGGPSGMMIGNVIQSMFGRSNNWPLGAAMSIISIAVVTAIVCAFLWSTRSSKGVSR
ncbi:MAG: ABC transporter permease [Hyphomicrobium sp.]|uniref:ABC transporter permease n=1 Tax=Hyphomicrobium sp. TaxID=82 RepID=UPI0039E439F4